MKLLRTINRLKDPRDLWLFLQILIMLLLLPGLIRKNSMPDLLKKLDPGVITRNGDPRRLKQTVWFIDSLLRYRIFQRYGKCLLRSLVLFRFLRQQGWPVEIHFGVRKTAEDSTDITGHSWLVLNGKTILEDENHQSIFSTTYIYTG